MGTAKKITVASTVLFDHGYGTDQLKDVANPAILYLSTLGSLESQKTMKRVLNQISRISGYKDYFGVPWQLLTRETVFKILARLTAEGLAPASRNVCLSAIKGVSREARLKQLMDGDTFQSIKLVKQAKYKREPKGRLVPASDIGDVIDRLLSLDGPIGVRDAAILGVMFGCGPRRSEVVSINYENWNKKEGDIKVIGKGDKERMLEVPQRTRELLELWIEERGNEPGALFMAFDRWGNKKASRLSHQAIYYIIQKRLAEAGLEKASPHDLRRSFITYLLDSDVDIAVVSDMAGHENVNTTKIYDLSDKKRNKIAAKHIKF